MPRTAHGLLFAGLGDEWPAVRYNTGMKATLTPWLMPVLCAGLAAATPEDPALQREFSWMEPEDPSIADIRRLGETTIQKVGNNLIGEVNRVLAAKGPETGIDDLHLRQLKLPAAQPGQPRIMELKRTSLKVRSPANTPDNADLAALMSIQSALADGDTPPTLLVQRLEAAGADSAEWRVYRPIVTTTPCLVCHGPVETLRPEVKSKLDRLYPSDKAVEYSTNEWRGVIRVSLAAPDQPADAPKKTTPLKP